ncbi:DedA family protein [Cellulomonas sp. KRMCY2]|uniref:DedA family protein n=1 Tax=Cellulomonas sp. KRMCY2 TaxID=1304865 RepID=UPI00045E8C75|nr:VTT domain-containing protein [Cellulomonas sp. KRMCY2]
MLEDWVIALAGSPWVFVALYLFAMIDGFFPPIPSETVVIALASLAVSTGEPNFWVLGAVAAAGAFSGDQTAYSIGRRVPVRRIRLFSGPRAQRSLDWAERALTERGAAFIIAARYVPVGRVAVNMTAGTVGFPRPRFSVLAAIAGISWSAYSVALGIGAGIWLGEHPLLAVTVGVVGGLLLGLAIDPVIRWFTRGRGGRPDRAVTSVAAQAGAVRPEPGGRLQVSADETA